MNDGGIGETPPDETSQATRSETGDPVTRAGPTHRPDPKLLELLVCPVTKTTLVYDHEAGELVSHAARLAFPIRDGVPILLQSEARELP